MGIKTGIAWTDRTFNGWRGCSHATYADAMGKAHAHQGCLNCYAEKLAKRNPGTLGVWGGGGTRIRGTDAYWRQPIKWDAEARAAGRIDLVFTSSLADVFEDWKGDIRNTNGETIHRTISDLRCDLFALIDRTPNLLWQVLTKRPQNVRWMWPGIFKDGNRDDDVSCSLFRPNVHLLTSISDQATADALIPHLLACRDLVPVLGVSAEPLLGEIDVSMIVLRQHGDMPNELSRIHGDWISPLTGAFKDSATLNWCIIGCESNGQRVGRLPGATEEGYWRAARSLIEQCQGAGVAVFHKQGPVGGRVSHDPSEWPEWARVQEFPQMR